MRDILKTEELDIPDGVDVSVKSRIITVKGPRGTLTKNVRHADVDIRILKGKVNKVTLAVWQGGRKHVAVLRTLKSLIVNLITGVTKVRFVYLQPNQQLRLLVLSTGFPIQDARCLRPFPHQRHHPGERQEA